MDAHSGGRPVATNEQSSVSMACLQTATPCDDTLDVRLHTLPAQQLAM